MRARATVGGGVVSVIFGVFVGFCFATFLDGWIMEAKTGPRVFARGSLVTLSAALTAAMLWLLLTEAV